MKKIIPLLRSFDNAQADWLIKVYNTNFPNALVDSKGVPKAKVVQFIKKVLNRIPKKDIIVRDKKAEKLEGDLPDAKQRFSSVFFASGEKKNETTNLKPFSKEQMKETFKDYRQRLKLPTTPAIHNMNYEEMTLFRKMGIEPEHLTVNEDFDLSDLEKEAPIHCSTPTN